MGDIIRNKRALLSLCALLLAGCSAPQAERNVVVEETRCCTTLAQIAPLNMQNATLRVEIDRAAPQIMLNGVARHARSVRLPTDRALRAIDFTLSLDDGAFLAARAELYSGDWQRLQQLTLADFTYQQPGALHGHQMLARMTLDASQSAKAAWLVIYADEGQRTAPQPLVGDATLYAEKSQTVPPLEPVKYARFSATGAVTVSLPGERDLLNLIRPGAAPSQAASPAANDVVQHYQQAMKEALRQQRYQEAAEIADRARQAGYQEASVWLVEQMKAMR